MRNDVSGQLEQLSSAERALLEKLVTKRSKGTEFVDLDLARLGASAAAKLNVQLGLLLGRDGRVTHVVAGTRDRLYLPDLGRYRLDNARLRRLRYIVFVPDGERILRPVREQEFLNRNKREKNGKRNGSTNFLFHSGRELLGPEISHDLVTDLEKLRFDGLLVVAVKSDGVPGPVTLAHLSPGVTAGPKANGQGGAWGIALHHARELQALSLNFSDFIQELESDIAAHTTRGIETDADRAILIGAYRGTEQEASSSMAELRELARTAGIHVLDTVSQRRKALDPKTVVGKGKLEEIVLRSLDLGANLLVFDQELLPGQLRSITNGTELRVIDRSMLILDIFAQRATTSEGRLQVELAQLKYSLPRLTEKDTGLSRLTGGIGGRGPGETKLEISRRRVRDRISDLERRIDKLGDQRGLRRERRQHRGVPVIAIVGYTNAGKSTLLNALTKGNVFVENKLFATLDPASRRMRFPNEREVIFVDTVGFIRDLPKELIAAFRATLEEVREADFLIHLVDATNPELRKQIEVVERTLESLELGGKPLMLVLNKVDQLSELETKSLVGALGAFPVSAVARTGFSELISELQLRLADTFRGRDPGHFLNAEGEKAEDRRS